jgi:hypothetical protein
MNDPDTTALEAATFRRLLQHLMHDRPDVQNIDLMILAGFCRNCLSDWYREAAEARGLAMSKDQAREAIYGRAVRAVEGEAPERGDTGTTGRIRGRAARARQARRVMAKSLLGIAVVAALAYAGACALLYARQRSLMYFPQYTRVDAAATDFALERDGVPLHGWVVGSGGRDPRVHSPPLAAPAGSCRSAPWARCFFRNVTKSIAPKGRSYKRIPIA